MASHRPEHERIVLEAATDRLRTMVVRPGVVYGGGSGMVGDIFKSATNGLVRVVGDGNNHWPLVYDRDLADLYAKLAVNHDASGIYHANDEGDERVNDIVVRDFAVPAGAAGCAARADRGSADEDGTVRRCAGARSGREKSARARARLDAHAAFGGRQRRAAARRVARVAGLARVKNTTFNAEAAEAAEKKPLREPLGDRSALNVVRSGSPFNRRRSPGRRRRRPAADRRRHRGCDRARGEAGESCRRWCEG